MARIKVLIARWHAAFADIGPEIVPSFQTSPSFKA